MSQEWTDPVPDAAADAPAAVPVTAGRRGRTALLGGLALGAAVVAIVCEIAGIAASVDEALVTGLVLAVAAIAISAVAVLLGVLALILRRGRRAGVVGIALGLLGNPLLQLVLLRAVGSDRP